MHDIVREPKRVAMTAPAHGLLARVIAGFAGTSIALAVRLILVPVYLKLLGAESFGLIGFYATLIAMGTILDAGLSVATNREMAKLRSTPGGVDASRTVVHSLSVVYWIVGVGVGATLVAFSPLIAEHWLRSTVLPTRTVTLAIALMGLNFACQWPESLYSGALLGLNQHVRVNQIRVLAALGQAVVTLIVLFFATRSVLVIFTFGALTYLVQVLTLRYALFQLLASPNPARFDRTIWRNLYRFAAGNAAVAVLSAVLTQLDKLVLSRSLPLDVFGYYALAASTAGASFFMATPITAAAFPDMSRAAHQNDEPALAHLYHSTSQMLAAFVAPIAAFAFVFADDLLITYLRDGTAAASVLPFYRLLVISASLAAMIVPGYYAQLANGWTSLSIMANVVAVVLYVPGLVFAIKAFGPLGAASMAIALNAGYLLIELPIMHRRILKGHLARWYVVDVGIPIVVSITLAGLWHELLTVVHAPSVRLGVALIGGALAVGSSALCLPTIRSAIRSRLTARRELT